MYNIHSQNWYFIFSRWSLKIFLPTFSLFKEFQRVEKECNSYDSIGIETINVHKMNQELNSEISIDF